MPQLVVTIRRRDWHRWLVVLTLAFPVTGETLQAIGDDVFRVCCVEATLDRARQRLAPNDDPADLIAETAWRDDAA